MGASSQGAQTYREAGLTALELGDEAILRPADFKLSGPEMRGVRQAVTRARQAGLTVRIRRHRDIAEDEMAQTITRADSWRDTETERGFSMALGRLGDPRTPTACWWRRLIRTTRCWQCCRWCRGEPPVSPGFDASFSTIPERHYRTYGQRTRLAR